MMMSLMIFLAAAFLNMLSLDGNWEYKSSVENTWHTGTVPGCVHLDLMSCDLIPDPYYGSNEKLVQWVGEKDWTYRRTFNVGDDILKGSHQTLVLEGVDTYAEVYLNGERVQVCDNMFRTWTVDVKDRLKRGDNTITVVASQSGTMTLRIESDSVIRGLHISSDYCDLKPIDDYLTIVPGYPRVVEVASVPLEDLKFTSLNQIL